ncbi:hypothetical protein BDY19DRAFT_995792 [Irpex rosettiformis]|uniref:Uncharacterized protein n=1 Tax=Irpex rosettiformis TaxID=378272 RepID=A0ACB8TX28_9APHY|nr:hypothetical protein BDY19DRAFT_995792 [Irpex rosettiformis]
MPTFEPDKSLLNAKFEGYKLDAVDPAAVLSKVKLEYPLTQSSAAGKSPLTFHEVQSRIRHNHLTISPNGSAVYVDSELKVVRIIVNDIESHPEVEVIYEIPRVLQSADSEGPHREYPSAAFLDEETLLVSDGNGALYVLQVGQTGQGTLLNSYELKIPEEYKSLYPSVPFRVHLARRGLENTCVTVLSAKHYAAPSDKASTPSSIYDIWAVSIDLDQVSQDQSLPLDIKWHRRGDNVPSYVSHIESKATFLLIGNSPYRPLSAPLPASYEVLPDEIAPIPRANESLDNASSANQSSDLAKPPPYSWTQTGDSVTVAFGLPSNTPKDVIKVTFSATTLTILIQSDKEPLSPAIALPHYTLKKFWDGIHTSNSFWTFDRQAEQKYGLLTLHLDKAHEGTKWPHLFAQQETLNGEPEVPETLDPSELYAVRESLEKYTAALQTGEDASGLGLGRGVPSLAEGELDDEVDLDTGDAVIATWVELDGSTPSWASAKESDSPFTLLATPLPSSEPQGPSIVAKNGLDGLVYTFSDMGEEVAWKHTSTFNVLSFVLASKRDTRFVHASLGSGLDSVLAFESGARGLGGNVYIYRRTAQPTDKYGKQAVLKVGDTSSGPLLGVGQVKTRGGERITLCLCERELAMIRDTV